MSVKAGALKTAPSDIDGAEFARQARDRLGLSQTEFGARLGLSKRTIIRWEQGEIALKRRDRAAIRLLLSLERDPLF
jgi:DNA-binding transcriptional regulator YiaG